MTQNKEVNVMKWDKGKIALIFQKFAGIMKSVITGYGVAW